MAVTEFETFYMGPFYFEDNTTGNLSFCDVPPCDITEDEYFCGEDVDLKLFHAVLQPVLFSLIFLLGVVGNGLMMTVLLRRRTALRITEIYLLHLAVADLMLLLTFPFDITETFTGWVFRGFLCKLLGLLKSLNLCCGSFLLACIGFDRYLAIVHAIPSMQTRRPKTVHLTCCILWLVCLGSTIPNLVFLSVTRIATSESKLSCTLHAHGNHAYNWDKAHQVLTHVCFFVPLAIMSYCYTAVVVTLRNSQRSKEKQAAIRLALLVTIVFCLCWLPYNIALLISTLYDLNVISIKNCTSLAHLQPVLEVTQSLGLLHCCLNPFLYAFVGVRFRNELIQLLCKLGCGRVCLPFIRVQGHSRPSMTDGATTTSTAIY
ncbi:C-X-C chemokine receptor type 5 [Genypterus blacodes]|uniref:C-X-C chemokine receptor type 5 n=1 Tax=Genypterus blacodes TaxID=154954 RepID=UPI003F761A72